MHKSHYVNSYKARTQCLVEIHTLSPDSSHSLTLTVCLLIGSHYVTHVVRQFAPTAAKYLSCCAEETFHYSRAIGGGVYLDE